VGGRGAVAEAGIDDIKAVEVVELPNFVFSPVSDKMRNTEKKGAAMAVMGTSPLTLKVNGYAFKVW
jgi:hypothetical protein